MDMFTLIGDMKDTTGAHVQFALHDGDVVIVFPCGAEIRLGREEQDLFTRLYFKAMFSAESAPAATGGTESEGFTD